jgi:hypothetical protein
MSSQSPAASRRAKAPSGSFAGLIAGSFIIAAFADEWRAAAQAGGPDDGQAAQFGGEDAFSFSHSDGRGTEAAEAFGASAQGSGSDAAWDSGSETALAPEVGDLSLGDTDADGPAGEDAAAVLAHHQTAWLIPHA